MEISIEYLNPEVIEKNNNDNKNSDVVINGTNEHGATWYSRYKSINFDMMDNDIKNSTVSHYVDRVTLNNYQIASKSSVEDLIEFLTKAKESFRH